MRDQCTIRAFDGCSCSENECKSHAVHLGRFVKARPAPNHTTTLQYALVGLTALFSVLFISIPALERVKTITQEERHVVSK